MSGRFYYIFCMEIHKLEPSLMQLPADFLYRSFVHFTWKEFPVSFFCIHGVTLPKIGLFGGSNPPTLVLRQVSIRRGSQAWREKFLFLDAARIKLNRETKKFSRHACDLRLMETSLYFGFVENRISPITYPFCNLSSLRSARPTHLFVEI